MMMEEATVLREVLSGDLLGHIELGAEDESLLMTSLLRCVVDLFTDVDIDLR